MSLMIMVHKRFTKKEEKNQYIQVELTIKITNT